MGFRFRKSVKLIPGVRMNFGMRGASVSVGGKGGRLTFGPRGTTASAGIPGTGISFQQRLSSSGSSAAPQSAAKVEQSLRVSFDLDQDGKVVVSSDGQPLPPKYVRMAFEQMGATIERWLQDQVNEINRPSKTLLEIHLSTPLPVYRSRFRAEAFAEPQPVRPPYLAFPAEKPTEPAQKKSGLIAKLIPVVERRRKATFLGAQEEYRKELQEWEATRERFEEEQASAQEEYRLSLDGWKSRKASFVEEQRLKHQNYEAKLVASSELMEEVLELALGELEWPLETNISFDIADSGKQVLLDVDLPEIENIPQTTARIAANKKRLLKKDKSQSLLRQEYAKHVHAIGFRLAGEVLSTLPSVELVVLSAYSQRLDKATGRVADDYLYSVEVDRASLRSVDFSSLERVDPIEALGAFRIRRKMTKTGVFRVIEPFAVATATSASVGVPKSNRISPAEFEPTQPAMEAAGRVDGDHYTDLVESVKQLKREKRHEEAIPLLLRLVEATEEEAKAAGGGWGVAPWYYEQLAILYRKERRYADEVAILERYQAQPKAPGAGPGKLAERLEKARRKYASHR